MSFILFKFAPIERIWGGSVLKTKFHREIPANSQIGETWELSDNAIVNSVALSDNYRGMTLREILKSHSDKVMGPNWDSDREFPVLIKWLDCEHPLSVQVHPTEEVAKKYGDKAKDECWYIASCPDSGGAEIVAGLKDGVAKKHFVDGLKDLSFEDCLRRVKVKVGDSVFIPAGTIHTMISPVLICEVQQNSDNTYRVYDWGRVDANGNPRQLHVEKSLEAIDFDRQNIEIRHVDNGVMCRSKHFTSLIRTLKADEKISFGAFEQPRILTVLHGLARSGSAETVKTFDTVLLPYSEAFEFTALQDSKFIITENFA